MSRTLQLFLFTSDPTFGADAVRSGVRGIVIDWERVGKESRQWAADTEINLDTIEDLRRMRGAVHAPLLCRVNPIGDGSEEEIDAAVAAGADEVLVPMVRRRDDVEAALEYACGRIGVGVLIETCEGVELADDVGRMALSRVYLGLNDLAIERHSPSIFSAVLDGTVDRVRAAIRVPFGFAGLTLPGAGDPIPCELLAGDLARMGCDFTFLRRSFRRDVEGRVLSVEVPRMHEALRAAFERSPAEVESDRVDLELRIAELESAASARRRTHA